jgi:translation initiation factor IF-1
MSGDALEMVGTVVATHRGDLYEIDARVGALHRRVLAKRSGRLVKHNIRILAGDEVIVEVGVYDTTRGRIVYRGLRRESDA